MPSSSSLVSRAVSLIESWPSRCASRTWALTKYQSSSTPLFSRLRSFSYSRLGCSLLPAQSKVAIQPQDPASRAIQGWCWCWLEGIWRILSQPTGKFREGARQPRLIVLATGRKQSTPIIHIYRCMYDNRSEIGRERWVRWVRTGSVGWPCKVKW
jgi:hypothetical protein